LRVSLEQLLSLYNDMLSACRQQREAIGAELTGLQRASKGAKVYQMFG
ncbi:pili length/flagellar attachment protein FleP, partial [Pseudomonas aeruginosa]